VLPVNIHELELKVGDRLGICGGREAGTTERAVRRPSLEWTSPSTTCQPHTLALEHEGDAIPLVLCPKSDAVIVAGALQDLAEIDLQTVTKHDSNSTRDS
jgi:hypothetical protein